MINSRTLVAISLTIATALAFAGCPTSTDDIDNGNDYGPIVETETVLTSGTISFTIPAGLVREAQLATITALVNGLDVTEFEGYVSGVNFANVPTWNAEASVGEDSKATITLPINVTAQQIDDAFDGAQEVVAAERERARIEREEREQAEREEAERIENERREQVIAELSAKFAGYISNITFADVAAHGYELDEDSDPVTASVTLPNNFTAEEGRTFIEDTVMESIESARDTDTTPVINFVTERDDGIGNTIRFYAEEGVDSEETEAFAVGLLPAHLSMIAPNVSRATQLLEVEGGRIITIGEDGRAILYRDGTYSWMDDIVAAFQAGQAAQQQAAAALAARW